MERGVQHVGAVVEDLLGPVAVVIVNIEYRHAFAAASSQVVGGDGGIVEEAEAAKRPVRSVVSGRAGQSVTDCVSRQDQVARRQRYVDRAARRSYVPGRIGVLVSKPQ